jgi:hypothetical protein
MPLTGVQGLVPVFGAEALNFTAVVSSIDDSDAPFPGFTTQFTRFTSTKVQILTHTTLPLPQGARWWWASGWQRLCCHPQAGTGREV